MRGLPGTAPVSPEEPSVGHVASSDDDFLTHHDGRGTTVELTDRPET